MNYTALVMKQSKRFPREIQVILDDRLACELYSIPDCGINHEECKTITYNEFSKLSTCAEIEFKICTECAGYDDPNDEEYEKVLLLYQVWAFQLENIFDEFCKSFGLWLSERNFTYSTDIDKNGMTFNIEKN